MSLSDPVHRASLSARVQGILLRPSSEWDRIDLEPATTRGLFTGYAMILAAIGPVCSALGALIFGHGVPGLITIRPNPVFVIVGAVVSYVLALVAVFVLGFIIDALAPTFGGTKNQVQAMKVAVYASTAGWVGGLFQIFPLLAIIAVLFGLYGLYLTYLGLPKLMRTTADKALGYTALVVVCYIVLFIVIAAVTAPVMMMGAAAGAGSGVTVIGDRGVVVNGADGSTVKVGGALAGLAAAGAAMQAQTKTVTTASSDGSTTTTTVVNGAPAVSADALKALLPMSVAGYTRGDVSAESGGAGVVNMSNAHADYAKGGAHMTVAVADTGSMGALSGIVGALGVNSDKETATGYEKVSTSNGRMVAEEYDRSAGSGKYSVTQGRAMVSAEGTGGATMDELKAAVAAVDPGRVAQLSHG